MERGGNFLGPSPPKSPYVLIVCIREGSNPLKLSQEEQVTWITCLLKSNRKVLLPLNLNNSRKCNKEAEGERKHGVESQFSQLHKLW